MQNKQPELPKCKVCGCTMQVIGYDRSACVYRCVNCGATEHIGIVL